MKALNSIRGTIFRVIAIGMFALTMLIGGVTHEASAAKYVAINCNSLYSSALYAADQYDAAKGRGDKAGADFWWSVYNYFELKWALSCGGDSAA